MGVDVAGRCVASEATRVSSFVHGELQDSQSSPPSIFRIELISGVEFAIVSPLVVSNAGSGCCFNDGIEIRHGGVVRISESG